jgi:hypothetical protein
VTTLRNDFIPFLLAVILLLVGLTYAPAIIELLSARLAQATTVQQRNPR